MAEKIKEEEQLLHEDEITDEIIIDEKELEEQKEESKVSVEAWKPKTSIGKAVKAGEVKDIDEVLKMGRIMEAEIVDVLMPNIEKELLLIGQAKGKFGGGQRRAFRQTQKKTMEGNKPKFTTCAVIGNKDGYIGIGIGNSKETVPAREKAFRKAKMNIFKIVRGCGSWECGCKTPHSIPFKVVGKSGSVEVTIAPAPKGKGLIVNNEIKKILVLAGIKDVWSSVRGKTASRINLIKATEAALRNLSATKVQEKLKSQLGMVEGRLQNET